MFRYYLISSFTLLVVACGSDNPSTTPLSQTCIGYNNYNGLAQVPIEISEPSFYAAYAHAYWDPLSGAPIIGYGPRYYQQTSLIKEFIRLHECAHHSVPTLDEIHANCIALINMRNDGLSMSEENEIANWHIAQSQIGFQYGGTGTVFWSSTLSCAN